MPNTVCQWSAGLPKAKRKATGFERPTWNWDKASQDKVRDALLALNETLPDLRRAAGRRDEVDPIRHLIVTATGWGLNPDKDAIYLNVTPKRNMGRLFTLSL